MIQARQLWANGCFVMTQGKTSLVQKSKKECSRASASERVLGWGSSKGPETSEPRRGSQILKPAICRSFAASPKPAHADLTATKASGIASRACYPKKESGDAVKARRSIKFHPIIRYGIASVGISPSCVLQLTRWRSQELS